MRENDICPKCKKGILEKIEANEPYHDLHLMCSVCDSTFPIDVETDK